MVYRKSLGVTSSQFCRKTPATPWAAIRKNWTSTLLNSTVDAQATDNSTSWCFMVPYRFLVSETCMGYSVHCWGVCVGKHSEFPHIPKRPQNTSGKIHHAKIGFPVPFTPAGSTVLTSLDKLTCGPRCLTPPKRETLGGSSFFEAQFWFF